MICLGRVRPQVRGKRGRFTHSGRRNSGSTALAAMIERVEAGTGIVLCSRLAQSVPPKSDSSFKNSTRRWTLVDGFCR